MEPRYDHRDAVAIRVSVGCRQTNSSLLWHHNIKLFDRRRYRGENVDVVVNESVTKRLNSDGLALIVRGENFHREHIMAHAIFIAFQSLAWVKISVIVYGYH